VTLNGQVLLHAGPSAPVAHAPPLPWRAPVRWEEARVDAGSVLALGGRVNSVRVLFDHPVSHRSALFDLQLDLVGGVHV
jgi:hypothetical protein